MLLAALAVPASAQEDIDRKLADRYFDTMDQKKQGFFTLADMQRIEGKAFLRTDENKDGVMTLSEFIGGIPSERDDIIGRFTKRFELADGDENGRVTMEEYMEFCVKVVTASDSNQDGMVTREEFLTAAGYGPAE